MKKLLQTAPRALVSSAFAGLMIGIGGIAFLKCDSAYAGALLFCVGLMTICTFGIKLFTGRVGYVVENGNYAEMALIWLGNAIGALLCAALIASAAPDVAQKASASVASRLSQGVLRTLSLSFFCGVMMFVAVDVYKKLVDKGFAAYIGILFCIPAFILCGFEHSVADMFSFSAAGRFFDNIPHILLVSLGNAIGSLAVYYAKKYSQEIKAA